MFENCMKIMKSGVVPVFALCAVVMFNGCAGMMENAGEKNLKKGNYEKAQNYYLTKLNKKNDSVKNLYGLAKVYKAQKKYVKAIDTLKKALAVKPGYTAARKLLAELYFEQGWMKDAAVHFKILAEESPKKISYWIVLGEIYGKAHQYRKAMRAFNHAKEIDPNNTDTMLKLATLYFDMHWYDAARAIYVKLLEKEPHNTRLHYRLAVCYRRKEQNKLAYEECMKILNFDPEHVMATVLVAEYFESRQLRRDALKYWEIVIRLISNMKNPDKKMQDIVIKAKNRVKNIKKYL